MEPTVFKELGVIKMDKQTLINLKSRFGSISHERDGVEFWYARELKEILDNM